MTWFRPSACPLWGILLSLIQGLLGLALCFSATASRAFIGIALLSAAMLCLSACRDRRRCVRVLRRVWVLLIPSAFFLFFLFSAGWGLFSVQYAEPLRYETWYILESLLLPALLCALPVAALGARFGFRVDRVLWQCLATVNGIGSVWFYVEGRLLELPDVTQQPAVWWILFCVLGVLGLLLPALFLFFTRKNK